MTSQLMNMSNIFQAKHLHLTGQLASTFIIHLHLSFGSFGSWSQFQLMLDTWAIFAAADVRDLTHTAITSHDNKCNHLN